MINAPAAPITAEALIGVRIERLARYGEAGVGAVVAAEANSWCGFVLHVVLEDGRRDRQVRYHSLFESNPVYRVIMTDKADDGEIDQLIAGAEARELLIAMRERAKVTAYAGEMAKLAHLFDGIELQAYAVKKEIGAMFSEYASRETKAVVAPIREAIHAQARTAVAEILETLDYVRPTDEEN